MTDQPEKISITADEAASLRKLNDLRTSNEATIEQFRMAAERRNADLLTQGRAVWQRLAEAHNLDLDHVQYDIAPEGDALIVLARRYGR